MGSRSTESATHSRVGYISRSETDSDSRREDPVNAVARTPKTAFLWLVTVGSNSRRTRALVGPFYRSAWPLPKHVVMLDDVVALRRLWS